MIRPARAPSPGWVDRSSLLLLLCLLATSGVVVNAQQWWAIRPPADYFTPDVDTTSATPLPRVPPSPYGIPANICPAADGTPYSVGGYPGTPYIIKPFVDLYHNPPELAPVAQRCRTGDAPNPAHCMRAFELTIDGFQSTVFQNALPACKAQPATWLMGYNGESPGPTLWNSVGHETIVRFTHQENQTFFDTVEPPCTGTRTGRPMAVHAHGSASLPPYDGWAEDNLCLGEAKDYVYPNQRAGTGWYHDHALHITLYNAYHGLAGFYLMSDKKAHGGCGEPYNLENIEERLLMLKDAVLTPDCQLYYDYAGPHNRNLFGDINTINGVPFPEMPMEPKWYRFRMLNAAVARPFLVKIKDKYGVDVHDRICRVFASEGGYRPNSIPYPPEGLMIAGAERYEFACNFAAYAGQELYLWNGNNDAMFKDVPYFCYSHLLAHITVAATTSTPNPPAFVDRLVPLNPLFIERILTPPDIAAARQLIAQNSPHRTFNFGRTATGLWVINGETWDTAKIAASDVGQNTWELWYIRTGGGWFHPIHMHMVDFFILQRGPLSGGDGLFAYERNTPKDMLFLGPGQEMWVITRFGAHRGDYMFHCHNLVHEDHDMMRAYTVVGGANQDGVPALNPSTTLIVNEAAGVIYNNFAYNDPMYAGAAAKPAALWPPFTPAHVQSTVDQNLYRIFYAQPTDIPGLQPSVNPWWSPTCAALPVFP